MKKYVLLASCFAAALAPILGAAEKKVEPCTLLNADEIKAITGEKPGKSKASSMTVPEGPQKGAPMWACMWPVGEGGMVTINMARAQKKAEYEAGLKRVENAFAQLEKQGWKIQKKEFDAARCILMVPPSSGPKAPTTASCTIPEIKGLSLSVGHMAATDGSHLTFDKVKALFDKARARL